MTQTLSQPGASPAGALPPPRLWIYTNYDCNLSCSYCVARSGPRVDRRGIAVPAFRRLIDEAVLAGVERVFVTGGEPFLLPDIVDRLRYAATRLPTTVLTNAMLFQGRRLESLAGLQGCDLTFQVSLDGGSAPEHDAYRGAGSWDKAMMGVRVLLDRGFPVAVGSTETPANAHALDGLRALVRGLGIPEERHFIRPLAKRGFSSEGLELRAADLVPELTVDVDGVYWHPLGTDADLLLTRRVFPLSEALALMERRYRDVLATGHLPGHFK